MSRSYYIYYRSTAPRDDVCAAIGAMLAALARDSGVHGKLLQRCDDATTWMEIYEGVAEGATFERELAAAVERFGAEQLLAPGSRRHLECFRTA